MKIKITQVRSSIGCKLYQKKVLIGLGLNKIHKSIVLDDTNSINGMIKKIPHLLKVEYID